MVVEEIEAGFEVAIEVAEAVEAVATAEASEVAIEADSEEVTVAVVAEIEVRLEDVEDSGNRAGVSPFAYDIPLIY